MRKLLIITSIFSFGMVLVSIIYSQHRISKFEKTMPPLINAEVPLSQTPQPSVAVPSTAYSLYEAVPVDSRAAAPVLGDASNEPRLETVYASLSADEQKEFKTLLRKAEALLEEVEELYAKDLEQDRISKELRREIAEGKAEIAELERERLSRPPINYDPEYFGEGYDVPNFNDPK